MALPMAIAVSDIFSPNTSVSMKNIMGGTVLAHAHASRTNDRVMTGAGRRENIEIIELYLHNVIFETQSTEESEDA